MPPSRSRQGHCWDNAVAESFFHPLQAAWISREAFEPHAQAHTAVFASIAVCYNRQRGHAAHGYLAPLAYEQAWQISESLCPEKC
jgi:putative transposase